MPEIRRFSPRGALALEPSAFGMLLALPAAPEPEIRGDVAIVPIRGPLMHHPDPFSDSYDDIRRRVLSMIEQRPTALILAIDSPGGLVSGMLDTAREIRARARAVGVRLFAYVDGAACSAAYALACAAEQVIVSATSAVGSIGCIDALVDATAADAQMGLRFSVITSGDRKSDGNPHVATTAEAQLAAKERVDKLADVFFAWVAETRPITVDEVRELEASIVFGKEAEERGLADAVMSLDELLASIASGQAPARADAESETTMTDDEQARAALQAIIDGDGDEKCKARARRALAALEADASDDDKPDDDKPDEEASDDDNPDEEATTAAALAASANDLAARVQALEARQESNARAELRASRPDVSDEVFKALAGTPVAKVKAILAGIPKPPKKPSPAAAASVTGTRGEHTGTGHTPDEAMDIAMGIKSPAAGIRREGTKKYLGVITPAEARARMGGVK